MIVSLLGQGPRLAFPAGRAPNRAFRLKWFPGAMVVSAPHGRLEGQDVGSRQRPRGVIQLAHTAELDADTLTAARALLYEVFDDMTDQDWEHALGGLHALAWDGPDLVGHASVVQRRLLHQARALRAGYVEGVGVRPDRQRQGYGTAMMDALERVVRRAYQVGALGASDEGAPFYAARGWQLWRGPSAALTPAGVRRTEDDDGGLYVLPLTISLDLDAELICDWRDGDVW
jgi:aminoglycoside 2'-N-acetyltransferase I